MTMDLQYIEIQIGLHCFSDALTWASCLSDALKLLNRWQFKCKCMYGRPLPSKLCRFLTHRQCTEIIMLLTIAASLGCSKNNYINKKMTINRLSFFLSLLFI